jgi:shikimate dehydrogenase
MNEVLQLSGDDWLLEGQLWEPHGGFYAVLGDPIGHSRSPAIQNAALAEREIDADYMAVRISAGQLAGLKQGPAGELLRGFNVTAPLKEAVSALCDGRTDQARILGAVNTVKVEDGKWLGHNTDSGGVLTVLSEGWPFAAEPARAVVLGAGGSARAAVDALARWGVEDIEVRNRSRAGQERFSAWAGKQEYADRVKVTGLLPADREAGGEPTVWICCLAGGVALQPFLPDAAGEQGDFLLDLRYGDQLPEEDLPLGFRTSNGLPVLLMQGGLSFAWWFGPPVPWQAMREALI